MAELKVAGSPAPGNGISLEDIRLACSTHSIEIGEIGHAVDAISELLESSEEYGPAYILHVLSTRLSDLSCEVDDMLRRLRAEGVDRAS